MSITVGNQDSSATDVFDALTVSHEDILGSNDPTAAESRLAELAAGNGDPEFHEKLKKLEGTKCKDTLCRKIHGDNGQHR